MVEIRKIGEKKIPKSRRSAIWEKNTKSRLIEKSPEDLDVIPGPFYVSTTSRACSMAKAKKIPKEQKTGDLGEKYKKPTNREIPRRLRRDSWPFNFFDNLKGLFHGKSKER